MGAGYLFKPVPEKAGKGPVFLAPHGSNSGGAPVITTADGKTYTGRFVNDVEGNVQFEFPREIIGLKDLTISYGGQEGKITSGGQSFQGSSLANWDARDKGSVGAAGGAPNGFAPGSDPTGLGFFPAYLGGQFPSPVLSNYTPIEAAPYQFTDPLEFAKKFGDFNRGELQKNQQLAKSFALDQLSTELQGLEAYAPAAAALKRRETSLDNMFNLAQRQGAVNQALPGVGQDLEAQRQRANTYASGGVPNEILDRSLAISTGSRGADFAASAGFGGASGASRNAQDLMNVQQRIQLGMQGEQLLGNNINQRANLFLPPTEYSQAGQQVNVMPSLSGSQLQGQARQEITQQAGLPTPQALQSQTQQNQYVTSLEQQTRQYNASNTLQNEQFNATNQNTFALDKFGYDVAYAGSVAGASQTGSNTQIALDQQQQAFDLYKTMLAQAQTNQQIAGVFQGLLSLFGGLGGVSGIGNLLGKLSDLLGLGGGSSGAGVPSGSQGTANNPVRAPDTQEPTPGDTAGSVGLPTDTPQPELPSDTPVTDAAGNGPPAQQEAADTELRSAQIMRSAGITNTPQKDSIPVGVDTQGRQLYSNKKLAESNDPQMGKAYQSFLTNFLGPTGALQKQDATNLDQIGNFAGNPDTLNSLNSLRAAGDEKGFVSAVLKGYLPGPRPKGITPDSDKVTTGINSAALASRLYRNWDRLSDAQKAIGIANLGIQGYKVATGTDLGKVVIPGTGINGTPGLNVSQTLGLAASGYDVYNLIKNWDQYSDIQKVVYGVGTASNLANTAQNLGLLKGAGAGQAVQGLAGATGVAAGAYTVYKGWGEGGTKGAVQGALGGASIAAGLSTLGYTNPYTAAAIIAVSIAGDAIKVGKSEDQGARDGVRSLYKKNGLVDDKYNVTLADGTKFDIGIDGHGGYHQVTNPDKLSKKVNKLNAWDLDYTNDLDYASGMGSIALSRLLAGGKGKNVDQLGNQLGNAALGNIGYNKEMTPENYAKMIKNQRAFYAQAGLGSKKDAYALAEQALKEERINQTDLVAMQQGFNMVFDDPRSSYATAQRLMQGRFQGLEVAPESAQAGKKPVDYKPIDRPGSGRPNNAGNLSPGGQAGFPVNFNPRNPNGNVPGVPFDQEQAKARNRSRYGSFSGAQID